ncbi:glycosyltransferase family 8 protein [Xylogone sp. PMI_703]|nr:glycosyltransferase family 8 protein [Xylogone sp. PMI_703]
MKPRVRYIIISTVLITLLAVYFFRAPAPAPFDTQYGRLDKAAAPTPSAIATFLTGGATAADAEDEDNYYYLATRTLGYQVLYDPDTRCNTSIPFLVLVTSSVPPAKRDRLTKDGATVIQVEDVPLPWWVKTGVTRWKDQFAKLHLFEMLDYERILFIDADTLLTRPICPIFEDKRIQTPMTTLVDRRKEMRHDEARLPAQYVFAARSDNALVGERDHPFPPPPTTVFTAGFWLAAPSKEMYRYLMSVTKHYHRFDPHTMEQSLLNYAFRRQGAMPWFELDYMWSATWPSLRDLENGVASLHEKLGFTGPDELRALWQETKGKMLKYYQASDD